jgi:hypothetical protein
MKTRIATLMTIAAGLACLLFGLLALDAQAGAGADPHTWAMHLGQMPAAQRAGPALSPGVTATLVYTVYVPWSARPLPFVGYWVNENPNTRGITRALIRGEGTNIFVHMWGQCTPECDWGEVSTTAADAADGVLGLSWTTGFKVETQQISLDAPNRLRVVGHVHYTDSSGRGDRDYTEYFVR